MWRTLEQSVYAAVIALLLIFVGNFLTGGWILRLLGGFAFGDVETVQAGEFQSDDETFAKWTPIEQTSDTANRKYICYFTRVSMTAGGTCWLRQTSNGWEIGMNPDPKQQRCVVSCLKIDRIIGILLAGASCPVGRFPNGWSHPPFASVYSRFPVRPFAATVPTCLPTLPRMLRHSFASIANDLGFTEVTIAALVGHAKGSSRANTFTRSTLLSSWLRTRSRATFRDSSTESNSNRPPTPSIAILVRRHSPISCARQLASNMRGSKERKRLAA